MLQAVHTTKHLSTAAFFYIHTFLTNRLHALPNNRLFFGTLFFIGCTHFLLVTISLLYLVNTGKK